MASCHCRRHKAPEHTAGIDVAYIGYGPVLMYWAVPG